MENSKAGGAVVYWIKGFRVRFPSMPGTFCPSARHFIHIAALHPGV